MKWPLLLALTGCYLNSYPVTATVAEDSTYRAETGGYRGTAWVVSDGYLITAGHLCADYDGTMTLIATSGRHVLAEPVIWYDTDVAPAEVDHDVCLLRALGPVGRPLVLARHMPAVGARAQYVGFPHGEFQHFEGRYLGDTDSDTDHWDDFTSTAPCAGGASGSAMFTDAGVYGVLVRQRNAGPDKWLPGDFGCVASPLEQITDVLDSACVGYTVTPDDPLGDS